MQYNGLVADTQRPISKALESWDYGTIENGVKKIDTMLHFGCFTLGYNQKQLVQNVCNVVSNIKPEIAETLVPTDPLYLNQVAFDLNQKLYNMTGYNSFYCLSGSDANEGAVKLASAYQYSIGNKHKKHIVALKDSYHGSTFMSSNIGYRNLMVDPFYTIDKHKGVIHVDRQFDLDDVNWNKVAAFFVETCSYGQNMKPYSEEFWNKLRTIQEKYDVLIVVDDIFFGGGKTGSWLGFEHLPVQPDIFTQGKAITSGFFPLAITYYTDKIKNNLPDNFGWDHSFTYSFSIAGIVSVLETLKILEQNNYMETVPAIHQRAKELLYNKRVKTINSFGNIFMLKKQYQFMLILPFNPTEEYWQALENTL